MFTFKRSLLATLTILIMLLAAESRPALAYTEGIKVGKERERALYHVNYIRKQVGIRPSSHSSILARSAAAHSKYTVEADEFGHYETRTGSPYYVGYRPADRAARFNYPDPSTVTENIYTTWSAWHEGRPHLLPRGQRHTVVDGRHLPPLPDNQPRTAVLGYGGYYKDGRSVSTLEFGNNYGLTGKMVRGRRRTRRDRRAFGRRVP
ncbi:MAG: CAP domain-containing protein [Chloroflexia bacterium]